MNTPKDTGTGISFFGSVTVGERGQIVIPAEARNELSIKPGDKLLVMGHPTHKGLMVCPFHDFQEFLVEFAEIIDRLNEKTTEEQP